MKRILKADLHNHGPWTTYKQEKVSLKSITDLAIEKGLDIMSIINFDDKRYERLTQAIDNNSIYKVNWHENFCKITRPDKKQVYLIRGQEIPTKEGHILIIGLKENLESGKSLEETINKAKQKDPNCIIGADHPYSKMWTGEGIGEENVRKYKNDLDYIEWNGNHSLPLSYNKKAEKLAKELNMPLVASSDAHRKPDIGRSSIQFKYETTDNFNPVKIIKTMISTKQFENNKKYNSSFSTVIHFFNVLYDRFKRKIGLLT